MSFFKQKTTIISCLIVYLCSYVLNVFFLVPVFTRAQDSDTTNLIAVFVDASLYESSLIKSDVIWYAKDYLQQRYPRSKALVFPINTSTFMARDVAKILENLYFDGVKGSSSHLIGTVLLGNIPLPVVRKEGRAFPSVYPYVDFVNQAYIFDNSTKFFEFNNNPTTQPEIWHGRIVFSGGVDVYDAYFKKLRGYAADSTGYIAKNFWYDDFVDLKKLYTPENMGSYVNNFLFAEDVAYHRFTSLILDYFKGTSTTSVNSLISELGTGSSQQYTDETQNSINEFQQTIANAAEQMSGSASADNAPVPTVLLSKAIQNLTKPYSELFGTLYQQRLKEYSQALARYPRVEGHLDKVQAQDRLLLGDDSTKSFLVDYNSQLQNLLDTQIADQKYWLNVVVPSVYELRKNKVQGTGLLGCTNPEMLLVGRYENYYFGRRATNSTSVDDVTLYRGTYRNVTGLDMLSGQELLSGQQYLAIGASLGIQDRQVAADKGYNFLGTPTDLDVYKAKQVDTQECAQACSNRLAAGVGYPSECSAYANNGDRMTMEQFVAGYRGGVSPLNIDSTQPNNLTLKNKDYRYARNPTVYPSVGGPLYDIAGSKMLTPSEGAQTGAYSYQAITGFASMQRVAFHVGFVSVSSFTQLANLFFLPPSILVRDSYCFPSERLANRIPISNLDFFNIYNTKFPTTGDSIVIKVEGTSVKQESRDIICDRQPVTSLNPFLTGIGGNYGTSSLYQYRIIDTRLAMTSPTQEQVSGMNVTTPDRPIDSHHSISFQGLGGDKVVLEYPDVYDIPVYKSSGDNLVLKSQNEIKDTLKEYLRQIVINYNQQLSDQLTKNIALYSGQTTGYDFLAQADPLATPNRTYILLDTGLFVDFLGEDQLSIIAHQLYQQNIGWKQRPLTSGVLETLSIQTSAFDINQKILNGLNYLRSDLTSGLNVMQAAGMYPFYQASGYEVAYLNSDGYDVIDSQGTPAFLKTLQDSTSAFDEHFAKPTDEQLTTDLEIARQNAECSTDPDGSVSLTQWPDAIKCWIKKTLKTKLVTVSYKNSYGPVLIPTSIKNLESFVNSPIVKNSIEDFQKNIVEYSNQRSMLSQVQQKNQLVLDSLSTQQQQNTQNIIDAVRIQFMQRIPGIVDEISPTQQLYAENPFDQQLEQYVTIDSQPGFNEFAPVGITLWATGDNCPIVASRNLCTQNYQLSNVDLSHSPLGPIPVTFANKQAGDLVIGATLCTQDAVCVDLVEQAAIVPGLLDHFQFVTPSLRVPVGGALPVIVKGLDSNNNSVGLVPDQYRVVTSTGILSAEEGEGTGYVTSDFSHQSFLFRAPNISGSASALINLGSDNQSGSVSGQLTVDVVTPVLTLLNSSSTPIQNLTYVLPDTLDLLKSIDTQGNVVFHTTNFPVLKLRIQDFQGNGLYSLVRFSSKEGLFQVGKIGDEVTSYTSGSQVITGSSQVFQPLVETLAESGYVEFALYPTMRAGDDVLTIQLPGGQHIDLPIHVSASHAARLELVGGDQNLSVDQSTSLFVFAKDAWGNNLDVPVSVSMGALGNLEISGSKLLQLQVPSSGLSVSVRALNPGGKGYVYAMLQGVALSAQRPTYRSFLIQNSFLPTQKLNVMYLNLFGSDRANGWSQRGDVASQMIVNSDKLLAVTTLLSNPDSLKRSVARVSANGEVDLDSSLNAKVRFDSQGALVLSIDDDAVRIPLGLLTNFIVEKKLSFEQLLASSAVSNRLVYIPELTDSALVTNDLVGRAIVVNGQTLVDFANGQLANNVEIVLNSKRIEGGSLYNVLWDSKVVGQVVLQKTDDWILTQGYVQTTLVDRNTHEVGISFAQGSTNAPQAVTIYDVSVNGVSTPQGFHSLENAGKADEGQGFVADFKNIHNFAAGQSVGEATKGFGSEYLINLGDPAITRVNANDAVTGTHLDGTVGSQVFSVADKTIQKTLPFDFNNDGLKDLLVVFNDGTLKLLKKYSQGDEYKDLGVLLLIADGIQEVQVGDVDGNGFPDILIKTAQDKLRVYKNENGVFDVDGTQVCLDVPSGPEDVSSVLQMFFEDMDRDGKLDIVTNDLEGSIKIFYGGSSQGGGNYLSTQSGSCDLDRQTRQVSNTKLVKQYGLQIHDGLKIYDDSLLRWTGLKQDGEVVNASGEVEASSLSGQFSSLGNGGGQPPSMDYNNDGQVTQDEINQFRNSIGSVGLMNAVQGFQVGDLIRSGTRDVLHLIESPVDYIPLAEQNSTTVTSENIRYVALKRLFPDDPVQGYKTYKDMNGGILKPGDVVQVTVHLTAQSQRTVTYLEKLTGPWIVDKDELGRPINFDRGSTNSGSKMRVDLTQEYLFLLDNLQLAPGQEMTFGYQIVYQGEQLVRIKVVDITKDLYKDIKVYMTDSCLKAYFAFIGNDAGNSRQYREDFIDITNTLRQSIQQLSDTSSGAVQGAYQNVQGAIQNGLGGGLPGLSQINESFASNSPLQQSQGTNGQYSLNLNLNAFGNQAKAINTAIDGALKGLCNGFSFGNGSCGGLPLPFNMAFLSPGDYNIFGCKLMEDQGLPVFFFPGTLQTPAGPVPFPRGQKFDSTDSFYRPGGGVYPSQIRIYLSPTLTMGLGVAICLGPMKVGENIPNPFRNIVGNCVVVAGNLPFSCPAGRQNQQQGAGASIQSRHDDLKEMGVCKRDDALEDIGYGNNDQLALGGSRPTSPFSLVTPAPDNIGYNNALRSGPLAGGLFSVSRLPTSRPYGNPSGPERIALKGGNEVNLKILGGNTEGVPKCIIQKWLDNQVKYIINNLSHMTIALYLPDLSQVTQGFDKINLQNLSNIFNNRDQSQDFVRTTGAFAKAGIETSSSVLLQQGQLTNWGNKVSNPFTSLAKLFDQVPLINVGTRDVVVQIPFIYAEDVLKYKAYLESWLKTNERVVNDWVDIGADVLGLLGIDVKNPNDVAELKQCNDLYTNEKQRTLCVRSVSLKKLGGTQQANQCYTDASVQPNANNITDQQYSQIKSCMSKAILSRSSSVDIPGRCANETTTFKRQACVDKLSTYVGYFGKTIQTNEQLMRVVKQNLKVLDQYKQFPFQLYDRIHVYDRYLTEVADIIDGTIGSLNTWIDINARRFQQYVDVIVLLVGIIKTRQVMIDFSTNRQARCSKCRVDNYDSYTCQLSMLCVDLPVLPIPPFKLPNIYLDFSKIDLGLSVLLPTFKFAPTSIPLPRLPVLPQPPQIKADPLGLLFQGALGSLNLPDLMLKLSKMTLGSFIPNLTLPTFDIPKIPILPSPPKLPELPSFIPTVTINLPTLPPPPKIPQIAPQITSALKVAEWLGKIYCIMKGGIGLVGEKGVKSRIEQLTQRTRAVEPFDSLRITRTPTPLRGMDLRIDSFVNLRFNFDQIYGVFRSIANQVNGYTKKGVGVVENAITQGSRILNQWFDQTITDPVTQNITIGGGNSTSGTQGTNSASGQSIPGFQPVTPVNLQLDNPLNPDQFNYVPATGLIAYTDLRAKLTSELTALKEYDHETTRSTQVKGVLGLLNHQPPVRWNLQGIERVRQQSQDIVADKRHEISELLNVVSGSYDQFLKSIVNPRLVAGDQTQKLLSTSLLVSNAKLEGTLRTQEHPEKSYLDLQAGLVSGFNNALLTHTPEQLNMDAGTYQKNKSYLGELHANLQLALANYTGVQLAQAGGGGGGSATPPAPQVQPDLAQYVHGVFVEGTGVVQLTTGTTITTGVGDLLINVVNGDRFVDVLRDRYISVDMNSDAVQDLVSWTDHTIQVKYGDQKIKDLSSPYSSFYSLPTLNNPQELADSTVDGYASFQGQLIKVRDAKREVRNFEMKGQNADQISFSRSHRDNEQGYLLQLNKRVDQSRDALSLQGFFGGPGLDTAYVIVVPEGTSLSGTTKKLVVPGVIDQSRATLQEQGKLLTTKTFKSSSSTITIGLDDLPRQRTYSRIAPLHIVNPTAVVKTYKLSGPRSNQVLGGRQLIADDQAPILDLTLERTTTQQVVSQGISLRGLVGTHYLLSGHWTDNVGVTDNWVEYSGVVVQSSSGDQLMMSGLFYTGERKIQFVMGAKDPAGNIQRQKVVLTIKSPDLTISSIDQQQSATTVTSILSKDIDEGVVQYQRILGPVRNTLIGIMQGQSQSRFPVTTSVTSVSGGLFELGGGYALYDGSGSLMVQISQSGDIQIHPNYAQRLEIQLSFQTHYPVVHIFDKSVSSTILMIGIRSLSLEGLNPVQLLQGGYQLAPLPSSIGGEFAGGNCIKNSAGDCVVYVSLKGALYMPDPYHAQGGGTYQYMAGNGKYQISLGNSMPFMQIQFVPQPFIK